jgi:AraC-like DNA-binding protein
MLHQAIKPPTDLTILVEPTRIVGRTHVRDDIDIEPDRPLDRILGGYALYYSPERDFALDRGGGWENDHRLVVVNPYHRHRLLRCEGLLTILIEPESVSPEMMRDERWTRGNNANQRWLARIERGFADWTQLGTIPACSIDEMVFGETLMTRNLDPRIAAVVDRIASCPFGHRSSVTALAALTDLSNSRLSHLFREQFGIPIRSFRAWKRARRAIALTVSEPVLLRAALDAGYADEAHFSRSMRKYFGQRANVMSRHWRRTMKFRGMEQPG